MFLNKLTKKLQLMLFMPFYFKVSDTEIWWINYKTLPYILNLFATLQFFSSLIPLSFPVTYGLKSLLISVLSNFCLIVPATRTTSNQRATLFITFNSSSNCPIKATYLFQQCCWKVWNVCNFTIQLALWTLHWKLLHQDIL